VRCLPARYRLLRIREPCGLRYALASSDRSLGRPPCGEAGADGLFAGPRGQAGLSGHEALQSGGYEQDLLEDEEVAAGDVHFIWYSL
jgi:hypothetical protein